MLLALRAGLAMYVAHGQMIVSRREYTNVYKLSNDVSFECDDFYDLSEKCDVDRQ